jgi:hypothetical protein
MKPGVIINIFIILRFIFELDLFYFFQDELYEFQEKESLCSDDDILLISSYFILHLFYNLFFVL